MANLQNLKPFKKGNQASKGHGRPKGSISIPSFLRKVVENQELSMKNFMNGKNEKKTIGQWIALRMVHQALQGDKAQIKEILDRLYGKPLQTTESQERIEIDWSKSPDELLDMIIEKGNLE